ncbi:MAG: aminotransferase class IV [Lautropia sp.]
MWTPEVILVDGELIPFAEASVHPLSLAVAYATTVFEGLRAYRNPVTGGYALFRLDDHLRRLKAGMKVMRFEDTLDLGSLKSKLAELIAANRPDDDVYIRLLVYIKGIGLMATRGPVGYTAAAVPRDKPRYAERGMHVGVSSWSRLADNASPPRIKATANYHNARLAHLQAQADGYDGALMLTPAGKVSEAPIACFFMVRDGRLITPSSSSNILESITRDTILTLHQAQTGQAVIERDVDRSELYLAEEAFLCGTGQEISPVVSIDRLPVGGGEPGPVTRMLQARYADTVRGMCEDSRGWLTPVG